MSSNACPRTPWYCRKEFEWTFRAETGFREILSGGPRLQEKRLNNRMGLLGKITRLPGVRGAWKRLDIGSVSARLEFDIWERPHYAFGVHRSAQLARSLGHEAVTVIEFGVAGGRGLLELEKMAALMSRELGIRIDVVGFDTGVGLPQPKGYRDLVHVWDTGYFEMDVMALKPRLAPATQLILGNVNQTAGKFAATTPSPIGFIAFDMDYWSSTVESFQIFAGPPESRLPRIYCYFDDLVWPEEACHNDFTGELRAISDFNQDHQDQKICPLANLRWTRAHPALWNDQFYVMHDFAHPSYTTNIKGKADTRQLTL